MVRRIFDDTRPLVGSKPNIQATYEVNHGRLPEILMLLKTAGVSCYMRKGYIGISGILGNGLHTDIGRRVDGARMNERPATTHLQIFTIPGYESEKAYPDLENALEKYFRH